MGLKTFGQDLHHMRTSLQLFCPVSGRFLHTTYCCCAISDSTSIFLGRKSSAQSWNVWTAQRSLMECTHQPQGRMPDSNPEKYQALCNTRMHARTHAHKHTSSMASREWQVYTALMCRLHPRRLRNKHRMQNLAQEKHTILNIPGKAQGCFDSDLGILFFAWWYTKQMIKNRKLTLSSSGHKAQPSNLYHSMVMWACSIPAQKSPHTQHKKDGRSSFSKANAGCRVTTATQRSLQDAPAIWPRQANALLKHSLRPLLCLWWLEKYESDTSPHKNTTACTRYMVRLCMDWHNRRHLVIFGDWNLSETAIVRKSVLIGNFHLSEIGILRKEKKQWRMHERR